MVSTVNNGGSQAGTFYIDLKNHKVDGYLRFYSANDFHYDIYCTSAQASVPEISSLSLERGSTTGGIALAVAGTGFVDVSRVSLGGVDLPSSAYTIDSATQITVTTPAHAAGSVDFTVTTPGGTSNAVPYIYERSATTLALVASSPSSTFGSDVTFTATLTGGAAPTGTVEFFAEDTLLGSAPVNGGKSVFTARLDAGLHTIRAVYSGDADNAGSEAEIDHSTFDPSALAVSAGDFVTSGPAGGPFVPSAFNWTVTNTGDASITVSLVVDGAFFAVSHEGSAPGSGTGIRLSRGQSSIVTATLNAAAALAPPGVLTGAISFADEFNGSTERRAVTLDVAHIFTSVTLEASSAASASGEEVTFTARVSPEAASGSVVFVIDGVAQTPSVLSGGIATFSTGLLGFGEHEIVARYDGDPTHAGSTSSALTHNVSSLGSVVIRQETDGIDAVFGFSSSTSALNFSVPTSGGRGESAAISLPAGSYIVTADDMSGAGFALTRLVCSDGDSTTDLPSRTASIVLNAGEALLCTFTSVNSREKTTQLIEDFLTTRAGLILANQPGVQRRIDRLNGVAPSVGNPVASAMGYLPGLMQGGSLTAVTSLAAISGLAGNERTDRFDAWFEGTFALFDRKGPEGNFSTASLGADYLLTPDLLLGGFAQFDRMTQGSTRAASTLSGIGWLVGPYATTRLSDTLYLDLLAAAGTSSNVVSPYGTHEDSFDATRWLFSASLQGEWTWDSWTFSPRARLSYFEETSIAYTDSLGVGIPSITVGLGQVAVGPAISYRLSTEGDVVVDAGVRFEGVADILRGTDGTGLDNLHGRIEGAIDVALPSGGAVRISLAHDGLGTGSSATNAKIRASIRLY